MLGPRHPAPGTRRPPCPTRPAPPHTTFPPRSAPQEFLCPSAHHGEIGGAVGFGLGVLISADSTVASDGAGAGVPDGVGTGVGGSVSVPTCAVAEAVSIGVALASTFACGVFACRVDGRAIASATAPMS